MLCKTAGSSGAYLMVKFSTLISESLVVLEGQYAGGRLDSMMAGGSCGKSRYSTSLSTELKYMFVRIISSESEKWAYLRSSSRAVQKPVRYKVPQRDVTQI